MFISFLSLSLYIYIQNTTHHFHPCGSILCNFLFYAFLFTFFKHRQAMSTVSQHTAAMELAWWCNCSNYDSSCIHTKSDTNGSLSLSNWLEHTNVNARRVSPSVSLCSQCFVLDIPLLSSQTNHQYNLTLISKSQP